MPDRFLAVEVTRHQSRTVYLRLDDADPDVAALFAQGTVIVLDTDRVEAALAAAEEVAWHADPSPPVYTATRLGQEIGREAAVSKCVWSPATREAC